MIKRTLTFDDLDGNEVTEDFYFNLNKLEIMEMELQYSGGLEEHIKKITQTTDGREAYFLFKELLLKSYGRRAEDNVSFEKEDESGKSYAKRLEQSDALGTLIMELIADANSAAEFVKGLLPPRVIAAAKEEMDKRGLSSPELPTAPPVLDDAPEQKKEPTDEELLKMKPQEMTHEQLQRAFALKNKQ